VAEQILDGVKHRARMRLHRDAVLRAQHGEIKRRHDVGERSGRSLVAADLQAVGVGANVVGVMDSPRRQPQHLAVQRGQHFQACGIDSHGGVSCDGEQVNSNPVGCAKYLKLWQHTEENWYKFPNQPHRP
jgi:hypothetical protein